MKKRKHDRRASTRTREAARSAQGGGPSRGALLLFLLPAAALAAVLAVYAPALGGPFLFDDLYLPFSDPDVSRLPLSHWVGGGRPLLMATYWLNYQASGLEPWGYHLFNVLLHFVNGLLVFFLAERLLRRTGQTRPEGWALFAAAVFLLHPLQTESVAYVASRSEVLSVCLAYAAYLWFLRHHEEGLRWRDVAAILLLFGGAVGVKEHTAVLPGLFLLTDLMLGTGAPWWSRLRRNWRLYLPMAAVGSLALVFVWRVLAASLSAGFQLKDFTWYEYFFTQCRAIWGYLRMVVLPWGQSADHSFAISRSLADHGAWAGLLALVAAIGAAIWLRGRYRLAAFGFLAFLLLLAPTSSFVPIQDPFAERRLYLPFLGLLLVVCDLGARWRASESTRRAVLIAVTGLLALLTYQRNQVWAGAVPMWENVLASYPESGRARFQLAFAYYQEGRCADSATQYEEAARLTPEDDGVYVNWALTLECLGQDQEALAKLETARKLKPTAHIYSQIGMIHGKRGETRAAREALETARQLDPGFDMTYVYLGHLAARENNLTEARAHYRKALALNPTNELAKESLALIGTAPRSSP